MPIAEEDGLVVDLVVGGLTQKELRDHAGRPVSADRVHAVSRFFKLLDQAVIHEPPADLIDSTLEHIARHAAKQ